MVELIDLICFVNDDEHEEDDVDDDDGQAVDDTPAEAILPVLGQEYLLGVGVRTQICSSELTKINL